MSDHYSVSSNKYPVIINEPPESEPMRRNSLTEYAGLSLDKSSSHRSGAKSYYNYNTTQSHSVIQSPRNSPVNPTVFINSPTMQSSYATLNSIPVSNPQYFRAGSSRTRSTSEQTVENDTYINRASSQILSNLDNDMYKENRLEVIIHDLQCELQKRKQEIHKKNSIISHLETELEARDFLISNLERENNHLRNIFKKKGNNEKLSRISIDNNQYRKLPQPPPRPSNFNVKGIGSAEKTSKTNSNQMRAKRNAISGESAKYLTISELTMKRIEKSAK